MVKRNIYKVIYRYNGHTSSILVRSYNKKGAECLVREYYNAPLTDILGIQKITLKQAQEEAPQVMCFSNIMVPTI